MVLLKYKGFSTFFIGHYALKPGFNEVKNEDFYKMMEIKAFRYRVEKKLLEVPEDFPINKLAAIKKSVASKGSIAEKAVVPRKTEEKELDVLSAKATLKLIDKSIDREYLQTLIYKDERPKIVEEAKKRLKSLKT